MKQNDISDVGINGNKLVGRRVNDEILKEYDLNTSAKQMEFLEANNEDEVGAVLLFNGILMFYNNTVKETWDSINVICEYEANFDEDVPDTPIINTMFYGNVFFTGQTNTPYSRKWGGIKNEALTAEQVKLLNEAASYGKLYGNGNYYMSVFLREVY